MSKPIFSLLGIAYVFVVLGPGHAMGAGRIKKIPLEKNINSTLIEWDGDVVRISKQEERGRTGSRLLNELYDESGRPELFDVYCEWVKAGSEGRTLSSPEFPSQLLPPQVIEWRREKAKSSAQFDPFAMAASLSGEAIAPASAEVPAESAPGPAEPFSPPETTRKAGGKAGRVEPRIPTTIPLEATGE